MVVRDPMDFQNNISHSSYRFREIQNALTTAFKVINQNCQMYQRIGEVPDDYPDEVARDCQPKNVL